MDINDMSKDERSLLIYFESCFTDFGGLVDGRRVNAEDLVQAELWAEQGFIKFGRLSSKDCNDMRRRGHPNTHWVELSDEAWVLAHQERRARAARVLAKRTWRKTCEV